MIEAEQGMVTGEVRLTPVQRWFLDQNPPAPHHFNQWLAIQPPRTLESKLLVQAVQHIIEHHDALRLRFTKT